MPNVKNMKNIVRSGRFSGRGACDYFKIGEEGREMYVVTKFDYCTFLPCEAKKSYSSDMRLFQVRSRGQVTMAWWPQMVALCAVFLGLAIFVSFYKPEASEQSQQEYREHLLDQSRQVPQDRREQMAAAAAVHGGPADEVVTIEPHPPYPGPRKDNANVPLIVGSPTSNPTTGNPSSASIATGYPSGTTLITDPMTPNSTTLTNWNPSGTLLTNWNPSGTMLTTGNPDGTPATDNPNAM
uniref:Uncharacterized protein n=1 Tax=Branchiostoma floridae TaxID=7739 RepID=C3YT68_BRAFL|eukprot:XP_002600423.1 hypothetical protein BRAFLDRAFT_99614 [Branchiostoma floridae]